MSELKEYLVTCKNKNDLDSLYDDMETPGGNLYIPDREVELVHRRPISRNTHYMLTKEEAANVANDPRVIACELRPVDLGASASSTWEQTANFEKTTGTLQSTDKNWGLYRTIKGETVANWGSNSITQISNRNIKTTASGKNVDVILVDELINPNHPEFAVNSDGTGGSRVNQLNWWQYSSILGYSTGPNYPYATSGAPPNKNHGTHVAGTACGNTQGYARDANIYNISWDPSISGVVDFEIKLWDYIRYFHLNKPINPETGRRNPTITNHSWGFSFNNEETLSNINLVNYRGTLSSVTGNDAQKKSFLEARGVPVPLNTRLFRAPFRSSAIDADISDGIDEGIIYIGAATNSYWISDVPGGQDYDNYWGSIRFPGFRYFTSRGSSPGAACICVGSVGSKVSEYKSNFSNWGPRVDIWAPGSDIISSVFDFSSAIGEGFYGPLTTDPRNSTYYLGSISGTSMSTPQVTGVIACLAEQEPNLNQEDALQYLIESSIEGDVGDPGSNPNAFPYEGFGNGNNRYLYFKQKRPQEGSAFPRILFKNRNSETAGVKYPRTRNIVSK